MTKQGEEFLSGVFSAMQHLVLFQGANSLAADIAKEHGIHRAWALKESKLTGFRVREMNKFIRSELSE